MKKKLTAVDIATMLIAVAFYVTMTTTEFLIVTGSSPMTMKSNR